MPLQKMAYPLSFWPSSCAGDDDGAADDDDASDDDDSEPTFELLGTWIYTGGFAGLTNTLEVSEDATPDASLSSAHPGGTDRRSCASRCAVDDSEATGAACKSVKI